MTNHEKRIRDFLSERATMRGLCPEQISGVNGINLNITDLRALLADLDDARSALTAAKAVSDADIWRLWDSQDRPELTGGPCPVKFARAILALRPQAVPMTREEKLAAWKAATIELPSPENCYLRGLVDAEAHHGITQRADGGEVA